MPSRPSLTASIRTAETDISGTRPARVRRSPPLRHQRCSRPTRASTSASLSSIARTSTARLARSSTGSRRTASRKTPTPRPSSAASSLTTTQTRSSSRPSRSSGSPSMKPAGITSGRSLRGGQRSSSGSSNSAIGEWSSSSTSATARSSARTTGPSRSSSRTPSSSASLAPRSSRTMRPSSRSRKRSRKCTPSTGQGLGLYKRESRDVMERYCAPAPGSKPGLPDGPPGRAPGAVRSPRAQAARW